MEKYTKVLNKLFNAYSKGVDMYQNDGSLWLIFTENKRWVIELSDNGTLWYNYKFFNDIFKMVSLEMIENQHYITKWVEDALQNGVKDTQLFTGIQNGIKTIEPGGYLGFCVIRGKKVHQFESAKQYNEVEWVIINGIKQTKTPGDMDIELTMEWMEENETSSVPKLIDYVINYGLKKLVLLNDLVYSIYLS